MQGNITDWGKEVKKGLIERGWSINDLAERIGKSRTRVYSKAKDSQAWKSSTGEMYKKTVLRRLCKLIDLDFDNIEQQKAYEDGGDAVFNQQSLPGATAGQALLPENDKPVDAFAAMKAQKQAEPVIDGMVLEEA